MDSKRQQIITKITERMALIRTDNGYETDFGLNVHDWEVNFDKKDFPALSVCDLIESSPLFNDQPTASMQTNTLNMQIRLFAETAVELRKGIADVGKAIRVDRQWSDLAAHTIPKRAGMINSEETFELAGAIVEIEIVYYTNTFDSYQ